MAFCGGFIQMNHSHIYLDWTVFHTWFHIYIFLVGSPIRCTRGYIAYAMVGTASIQC
jgi:hypothetical protein